MRETVVARGPAAGAAGVTPLKVSSMAGPLAISKTVLPDKFRMTLRFRRCGPLGRVRETGVAFFAGRGQRSPRQICAVTTNTTIGPITQDLEPML